MRESFGERMRKFYIALFAIFSIMALFVLGNSSCSFEKEGQKVVFIDLEAVIAVEKKRIFSQVLRGEISGEIAEKEIDQFFLRFGNLLSDYENSGFVVLDGDAVLGGGKDVTKEVINRLSIKDEDE